MIKLLKVSKYEAQKGICHTRGEGDVIQKICIEDADLISYKYAFFIIECQKYDKFTYIKRDGTKQTEVVGANNIYYEKRNNVMNLKEMCQELLIQKKEPNKKLEDLISANLDILLSDKNEKDIWEIYEWILKRN